jgi:ankyrin repeat protein
MKYPRWILIGTGLAAAVFVSVLAGLTLWFVYTQRPSELVIEAVDSDVTRPVFRAAVSGLAWMRLRHIQGCPDFGPGNSAIAFMTVNHQISTDPQGSLELTELFIKDGCDVNAYRGRYTPLLSAVLEDDAVMVQFLLQHGADPKLRLRPAGGHPSPSDGLDAHDFAVWIRDKGRQKRDMSAVIAALEKAAH